MRLGLGPNRKAGARQREEGSQEKSAGFYLWRDSGARWCYEVYKKIKNET